MAHEYLAWAGSVLILVHAGIHFNARLPWLATYMLLITVASGLVGKYLLRAASRSLEEQQLELVAQLAPRQVQVRNHERRGAAALHGGGLFLQRPFSLFGTRIAPLGTVAGRCG